MKIDFHSHILPDTDDGAATIAESLRLLRILKNDGVDAVVATPHLYLHRDSFSRFLERRKARVELLREAIEKSGEDLPRIIVGAEVYFTPGLSSVPLEELCIENTDYMLLEMEYRPFTTSVVNSVANFVNSCEVNIILAHIERYYNYYPPEGIDEVIAFGLPAQGNCESFISPRTRARAFEFVKNNIISVIGTDTHKTDYRPPNFKEAEDIIRKKLSDKAFEDLMQTARDILKL